MDSVQKYTAFFCLSFRHALKNYKALAGLSIFLVTCLIIFANLWKIAAAKTGAVSLQPDQLLWYIAFNEWVLVSIPDTQDDMEEDLRSGRLAYLLPRPISYPGATFAEAAGTLAANLIVLGIVTFAFTWWQAGALPFHPMGLPVTLIFGFLSGLIAVVFQMIVGLSAFWVHDVNPFYWIWEKMLFMLGGLMLPLAIYPEWMQMLAHLTPFPAILSQRSSLALDFNIGNIAALSASLFLWGLLGLVTLTVLYRKGLKVLNVEGG
jgi:ABC-2 type transport system permease protein